MATACESGSAGSSITVRPGRTRVCTRGADRAATGWRYIYICKGFNGGRKASKANMERGTRSGGSKAPWREWRYVGADIKPYYGRSAASRESSGVMDLWYAFE